MDAAANITQDQSISALEQITDGGEKNLTSIDFESGIEKKTKSDNGLGDEDINRGIYHLSNDAAGEMEEELEGLSTEDIAELTKQIEDSQIESKTPEPTEKETLKTDTLMDEQDILANEAPIDGTTTDGTTTDGTTTDGTTTDGTTTDEISTGRTPTDGTPTEKVETNEINITEKNKSFTISKDKEGPKSASLLQDHREIVDKVGQLKSVPDGHDDKIVLSVPQTVGMSNDDKQSDMYYISGCESSISRASNFSQYTHFTTESAVTTKHKNTTANNWLGDDFSVISENHNVQANIPLMTTLETEEYRKERDRLEMRKLALSSAYKGVSGEKAADTLDNKLNVVPNVSYASSSLVPPPPPPPPQPTAPPAATVAPGSHPSASVYTDSSAKVHKEVEMKTLNKFQNGKD
jgi:hypothetical protein